MPDDILGLIVTFEGGYYNVNVHLFKKGFAQNDKLEYCRKMNFGIIINHYLLQKGEEYLEQQMKQQLIADQLEIKRKEKEREEYLANRKACIEQYLQEQRKLSFEEWQSQFLKKYQRHSI